MESALWFCDTQVCKESLNSDDIKFHQYQQNEQSPLILTELPNTQKTMTYDIGNPGSGLEHAQKSGGVKPINGIPTLLSYKYGTFIWL